MSAASPASGAQIAGVLLTGGSSKRMGTHKALLQTGAQTWARRIATLLDECCNTVIEVGPGWSGLRAVREDPPGQGPLVAVATASALLEQEGFSGPTIVIACDLPLLSRGVLEMLATWPGHGAVLPVVDGMRQPLCARWSWADMRRAVELAEAGQRSLKGLPGAGTCDLADEPSWRKWAREEEFSDADSPRDLVTLGLLQD